MTRCCNLDKQSDKHYKKCFNYYIKLSKIRDQNSPRAYNEINGFLNKLTHTITFTKCGIAYDYVRRMNSDYATTSCISDLAPLM